MFAIKIKDRYIKYIEGSLKYVDNREDASHYKTLNGLKWAVEELKNRQNYTDVTYEQFGD